MNILQETLIRSAGYIVISDDHITGKGNWGTASFIFPNMKKPSLRITKGNKATALTLSPHWTDDERNEAKILVKELNRVGKEK